MSDEKASDSGSGGGQNKLVLIVLALNIVFMAGVAGVVFTAQKKQDAAQSIEKLAEGATHTEAPAGEAAAGAPAAAAVVDVDARFYNVGEFTANLSGPGASHYVRLQVNLELDKQLNEEEMKKRTPQIRDKVITLLNSKRPQDLQTADGRTYLKDEMKASINSFLQTGKIVGVYFSTFVFE